MDDLKKTLKYLRENHPIYYMVYRLLLESGTRLKHVLEMIKTWDLGETIEVPNIDLVSKRLVCTYDSMYLR